MASALERITNNYQKTLEKNVTSFMGGKKKGGTLNKLTKRKLDTLGIDEDEFEFNKI